MSNVQESKEKNREQMNYIFQQLKNISTSQLTDKYTQEMENINIPLINEILENRFTNGPDMNALLCLFDKLIISSQINKEYGLYHLSTPIQKWTKKLEQLDVKSAESKVYTADILNGDIHVIIKSPKTNKEYDDLIREYFIGITQINKLRYHVPNFMYTMGAFLYPHAKKTNAFVIYEKIPGESLEHLIKTNNITFEQYLSIFIQILLALEIAQRTTRFCHFDLHANNIIIRPVAQPLSYTLVIDNKRYDITTHNHIPILIDFGMSTVTNEKHAVGSYHYPCYGMMNYLVQGADMYKLLFYSSLHSTTNKTLHRQILELFTFYGINDPYKILIQEPGYLKKISYEFAKRITFSQAATYTPLNFAKWIINKPEYRDIIQNHIKIEDRDVFFPLNYSSTIHQYSNIFNNSNEERCDAINTAINCTDNTSPSYILLEYTRGLLNMYDEQLYSDELKKRLSKVNTMVNKHRKKLIQHDKKILSGYTKLIIPDRLKLHDYIERILTTKIGHRKNVTGLINRFLKYSQVYKQLSPYLQFLYTIKELHLDDRYKTYRTFVSSFKSSVQYKFYEEFHELIERTVRWSMTLIESSKV